MTEQLRTLLLQTDRTNPAMDRLLEDYARYHLVFAVLGAAMLAALGALAVHCVRRFRRAPRVGGSSFERRSYASVAIASGAVFLVLGLVVVGNFGNALSPAHGFAGAVHAIPTAHPGTPRAALHDAFTDWLQAGAAATPSLVQDRIDDRLAWQRPKAFLSALALVGVVVLARRLWRRLVESSRQRASGTRRSRADRARLTLAVALGPVALVLAAMVLGNTQASMAPITMTLVFG